MHQGVFQILLLLGSGYCNSEYQSSKKCHKLSGEDANINLEEAVHTFINCFIANVENFRHMVANMACTETSHQIKECNNSIMKKITECNSPDEQHFPKSVFKIVSDYAEYICSQAPSYKFHILLEHKVCFPSLSSGLSCFEKFRFFNVTATVSKEEMCSDHQEVKECLLEYANSTCSQDTVFPQLVIDTFNFDGPPCKSGTTALVIYNFILLTFAISAITLH